MGRRSRFQVVPYRYPNGRLVFKVRGVLFGTRIREFHKDADAAEAARIDYDKQAAGAGHEHRPIFTWLSQAQVKDAESAVQLLGDRKLSEAARFYQERKPAARPELAIEPIKARFLRDKSGRAPETIANLNRRLTHFFAAQKVSRLGDVTFNRAARWINDPAVSKRTQVNRRAALTNFAGWMAAKARGYVPVDLLEGMESIEAQGEPPRRLTASQVRTLMEVASHEEGETEDGTGPVKMLYNYVLRTFAGLRPSEVLDLAIHPEWVNLREGYIFVDPRMVKLTANARAWIQWARQTAPEVVFKPRIHERVKRRAKLEACWQPDICRHTYGSFALRRLGNVHQVAEDMGNSVRVVKRFYAIGLTDEELKAFDEMLPPRWKWVRIKGKRVAVDLTDKNARIVA